MLLLKTILKPHHYLSCLLLAITCLESCEKLVDVDAPGNKIASISVYSSDPTAIAVLNGLYTKLSSTGYSGIISVPSISMWAALSADELSLWSGANSNLVNYYRNALSASANGGEFWTTSYPYIYYCNDAITGLNTSVSLTPAVKKQLLGEAKFLRALFYFYLVNLYGDVPLVLSTDFTINDTLARSPKASVYRQIIGDLQDAQNELVDGYVKADAITLYPANAAERVRPNKAAATALLARVYLYTGDYVNAEAQASLVINNTTYYSLPTLNAVFLKNSNEAIWQWQPVTIGAITNTPEAATFILSYPSVGLNSTHPVYLSKSLLNSFETGDQRKINLNWVNTYTDASGTYYYPYKYKVAINSSTPITPTEYTMVLRLGEQYLIRAEARAQQGHLPEAASDLNAIRARAGLGSITPTTQSALLSTIMHERQVELFMEFGHRWFDMKRTGAVDSVMGTGGACAAKGGTWNTAQQLYPLPAYDLSKDLNLIQNPGY